MKRITLLFVLFASLASAQTPVFTNFDVPYAIIAKENIIYVADYRVDKIYKFNTEDSNPVLEEVLTTIESPSCFLLNGNDLYIGALWEDKIYKIDITDASPTPVLVASDIDGPSDLILNGNDLYISEYYGQKISKIDITDANPTPVEVITGLNVAEGIALHGNNLYIADYADHKIYKTDITDASPTLTEVVGFGGYGLHLLGDMLYVADTSGGRIAKFDVTEPIPTVVDVVTGVVGPNDLTIVGSDIYFTELSLIVGRVSKFTDITLSTKSFKKPSVELFPNPTANHLIVSGIENKSDFTIYNMLGKQIMNGTLTNQEKINVEDLSKGLYVIQLDNNQAIKFLKD